jgi:hypothetical protein
MGRLSSSAYVGDRSKLSEIKRRCDHDRQLMQLSTSSHMGYELSTNNVYNLATMDMQLSTSGI